jgi:feruloyl esterase
LEDSSICNFNPETILCSRGLNQTSGCLTTTQAQTVRAAFSPLYGLNNSYLYPRLSPSAELSAFVATGFGALAGGLLGPGPVRNHHPQSPAFTCQRF